MAQSESCLPMQALTIITKLFQEIFSSKFYKILNSSLIIIPIKLSFILKILIRYQSNQFF